MFIELNSGAILNVMKIGLIQTEGPHVIYTMQNGGKQEECFNSPDAAEARLSSLKAKLLKG